MPPSTQFKLPSLGVFLSKNRAAFELATKTGMAQTMSWDQQEQLLRQEWHMMSTMDKKQIQMHLEQRHRRELPAYQAMKKQLDALLGANDARKNLVESVKDVREQEAYTKAKRSSR